MKRFLAIATLTSALLLSGCDRLEWLDEKLSSLDQLEGRVAALEKSIGQLNGEVSLINKLLSDKYFVKSVERIENPSGYRIIIVDSKGNAAEYSVYDGTDGQNGMAGANPDIGIRLDEDGRYYWTLNGEWLLIGGEKVRAGALDGQDGKDGEDGKDGKDGENGKDGKDGITPEFKVEDGKWYARLGQDSEWEYVGEASGSYASLISSIDADSTAGVVIFTLSDGSKIAVPKEIVAEEFRIIIDINAFSQLKAGQSASTAYEIKVPEGLTYSLDSYEPDGWTVTISKPVSNEGTLTVSVPSDNVGGGEIFFIATGSDGSCTVKLIHVGRE